MNWFYFITLLVVFVGYNIVSLAVIFYVSGKIRVKAYEFKEIPKVITNLIKYLTLLLSITIIIMSFALIFSFGQFYIWGLFFSVICSFLLWYIFKKIYDKLFLRLFVFINKSYKKEFLHRSYAFKITIIPEIYALLVGELIYAIYALISVLVI